MLPTLGKFLIIAGVIFVALGVALLFSDRLPGDIIYRRGNFTCYFPVVTSIQLSLLLTLQFWILGRR